MASVASLRLVSPGAANSLCHCFNIFLQSKLTIFSQSSSTPTLSARRFVSFSILCELWHKNKSHQSVTPGWCPPSPASDATGQRAVNAVKRTERIDRINTDVIFTARPHCSQCRALYQLERFCLSICPSVRPSVRHVPVLYPDERRYARAVFSIWQDNPSTFWRGKVYPDIRRGLPPAGGGVKVRHPSIDRENSTNNRP